MRTNWVEKVTSTLPTPSFRAQTMNSNRVIYVTFAVLCCFASIYGLIALSSDAPTKKDSTVTAATVKAPSLPSANASTDASGAKEARDATATDPSAVKAGNAAIVADAKTALKQVAQAMTSCQSGNLDQGYLGCDAVRLIKEDSSIATILNDKNAVLTLEPATKDGFRILILAPTKPVKTQFSYWQQEDDSLSMRCKPVGTDLCSEEGTWN